MKAVPENLPTIAGDSIRLEQVLSNLVDNALKFTPKGGTVTVGAEDLGDGLKLWVADTGIGIPPEERDKIFQKFYQVSGGANTPAPRRGAGLGLTICKHIVEQHGGRIWVESEPGRGSTFYIELPRREPSEGNATSTLGSSQTESEHSVISVPALEAQPAT